MSPKLGAHRPEPFVEVHPLDAKTYRPHARRLRDACAAGTARASSRSDVSDGQQRGSLFVPIHWSDANASSARVGDLVAPQTDPYSGQPEAKATPVAIAPVAFAYQRLCAGAHPDRPAERNLVGAGRSHRHVGLADRQQRRAHWPGASARRRSFPTLC